MKIRNNSKLTAGLTGVLMILFIMLTGGTALAAGTGSTGSSITAQTVYTYEDDAMKVTATLSDGSAIPAGSTLKVDTLTDQTTDENVKALYTDAKTMIDNQAANEKYTLDSFAAYNIYFKKDDNTYVPSSGTMTLEVTYKAANAPEAYTKSTAGSKAVVVYQKTQIKDILGNSTYILSNLGTAKDADQKDIISKKELDESGSLKALTFKESTYLPVILAWTENNAQAAANGAVTPTPTAAPSVTAAPTAEPSTTADENAGNTTVTPTAEPSATAAPSTTVENGNDSGTDKADAANNTVNKDDFNLGDNQTTNESLVDGSTGSGILTDNTAKGVTSTDANGKKIRTYTYKSDDVTVTVTADDTSALPDGAVLKVTPQKISDELELQLAKQAEKDQKAIRSARSYDISFLVNGVEVEPTRGVTVSMTSSNVKAGDNAVVYHVSDDAQTVTNVNAAVSGDGKVEFEATHFSNYVITNSGATPISLTIRHFDDSNTAKTELYSADTLTLDGTKAIGNYAKAVVKDKDGKSFDWYVDKVVVKDNTGQITRSFTYTKTTQPDSSANIYITTDATIEVYYMPVTQDDTGAVTFYDYTLNTGKNTGINDENNYSYKNSNGNTVTPDVAQRIGVGKNGKDPYQKNVLVNDYIWQSYYENNNTLTQYKNYQKYANQYEPDHDRDLTGMKPGIVTGMTSNANGSNSIVVFGNCQVYNSKTKIYDTKQLYDPGLFTSASKNGKTIYNKFNLGFSQTGNTYTLTKVTDTTKTGNSATTASATKDSSGNYDFSNFFPLNSETHDKTNNNNNNEYFGMRYDIQFSLGDYIGDLNYTFSGDDDLWVILDGKPVLDIGGLHGKIKGSVDLWTGEATYYGYDRGATDSKESEKYTYRGLLSILGYSSKSELANLTTEQKNAKHYITVLYMERGGTLSNCNMTYTLPNAKTVNVTDVPNTNLSFNKFDMENNPVSGAVFKLYDAQGNVVNEAISTGAANNNVTFTDLVSGEYTMKETTVPGGYRAIDANKTWVVKVAYDGDKNITTATLYESDGTTLVANNTIYNYKINVQQFKTAHLVDWTNRTYTIDLYASHNTTGIDSAISGKIVDTIDKRFVLTDRNGTALTNGAKAYDGGVVSYDSTTGIYTITWNKADISKSTEVTSGWHKTIYVKAKADYIGGNNVLTNDPDNSYIEVDGNKTCFDKPTVNVKVNLLVNDASKTIFWGETTSNTSTDVFNTSAVQGIINDVKQTYSGVDSSKLKVTWYTDSACTDEYKVDPKTISPETDVTYYAQVTYDAGAATDESNANTTLSDTSYKNGDGDSNLIYALNSTDVTKEVTSPKTYGTYAIHVVKGQIQITKEIKEGQYSNISAINSNQTFVFKIQRFNLDEAGTGADGGAATDTFYETINFNANQTEMTKSKVISQLKKGWYVVTEESSWSPKYTPAENGTYTKNYAVGVNKGTVKNNDLTESGWQSQDIGKTKFTGLEINSKTNKNATQYAIYAVNVDANGNRLTTIMNNTFTNTLKSDWNWLSDTAAAVNQFTK